MKSLQTAAVPSPCTGVCQLDSEDICLGCFRSRSEIARWTRMTADEQSAVIAGLKERRGKFAGKLRDGR